MPQLKISGTSFGNAWDRRSRAGRAWRVDVLGVELGRLAHVDQHGALLDAIGDLGRGQV